ncbi:MAG: NAD-dependent epimerase/dehydratase family protein [Spirochaetales bacterium]|jgi:dihydroflavonol-4-reductase|nr:NAD-dependent epimerase/dehydratase family protein [Spirochaetales bacterium]
MGELVLVSGGDGFLGTNLVRELLGRNYRVRILTEPGREPVTLAGLDVEVLHGDIRSAADFAKAAENCDYLVHTAASTSIWPARSTFLEEINIEGTRNALQAAELAGVKRLIHVGSANSFGFGTADDPGDETREYSSARYGLGYMDTKRQAHELVLDATETKGLPALVVAPTFMLGPYDTKPGSGRMILSVAHREVPGYTLGGRCYIYVKDVACGIANALTKGKTGESYIFGNENLTYKDVFSIMAEVAGVKAPGLKVPPAVSLIAGAFGSFFGRILNKEPKISLPMARISKDCHFYTAAKAVRELELPQTPIVQAIEEAYRWFYDNGYIKAAAK